ncbi:MAG TPA: polysaccharide deacetylase family protein [Chthoniobacterales bacterium]|nr:polysaccharide deacetylase family protein [Chthoniobacterales bacterium]
MTSVAATPFLPVAASATATTQSLIVSLHDVAPGTSDVCKNILAEFQRHGIKASSLLVVPNYHHRGSSFENRSFVSWLQELEAAGHEIVIHGYFHQRPRRPGESLGNRFLTQVYTQDEGEFFDIEYKEARRRITTAREEFEEAGLKPHGFVAPAWLLGAEAERAVRDAGIEYTTRLASVHDLRSGDAFNARSLVYSVRNGWRRAASLCWNAALAQIFRNNALMRVSVHPVDYEHAAIWQQIIGFLREMASERTPTTYRDWMVEWRIKRGLRR